MIVHLSRKLSRKQPSWEPIRLLFELVWNLGIYDDHSILLILRQMERIIIGKC